MDILLVVLTVVLILTLVAVAVTFALLAFSLKNYYLDLNFDDYEDVE